VETEPMVQLLRHRQTKEAATDMLDLPALRHIPTLPDKIGVVTIVPDR